MRRLVLGLLSAMLISSLGAAAAVAAPPTGLKLAPDKVLNFGSVPVGSQVIKPVYILNRTDTTLYYLSAPNGWPGQSFTYPYGIWGWAGPDGNAPFPCPSIAPKSTCELDFSFIPYQTGPFTALDAGGSPLTDFELQYGTAGYGDPSGTNYTSNSILMIGTGR